LSLSLCRIFFNLVDVNYSFYSFVIVDQTQYAYFDEGPSKNDENRNRIL